MLRELLLLTALATSAIASPFGTVQSASVKGKLTCNGQPAGDVKVKLYDVDTCQFHFTKVTSVYQLVSSA